MATAAAVKEEPATRFAKDQLKSVIERVERLEEEKKTISDDIRDVYSEAKGNGYDVKALRRVVRMRRMDGPQKAAEAEGLPVLHVAPESAVGEAIAAEGSRIRPGCSPALGGRSASCCRRGPGRPGQSPWRTRRRSTS